MFTDGRTPDSSLYPPNQSVGDKNVIGVRVFVLCTSSDDDLYLFKVSLTYSQWYLSYRADTIYTIKISKGHNSVKM